MATYYIRKQLLGANHRMIMRNEKGQPIYLMVGKWGNKNDCLSLYNMGGELIAEIKQTNLSLFPQFEIYVGDVCVAKFKKRFHFQTTFFFVSKLNWLVKGNFDQHQYFIQHRRERIMEMSVNYFANGSFYAMLIPDEENVPICLCIAAVIDHWLIKKQPAKKKLRSFLAPNKQPLKQNFSDIKNKEELDNPF